MSRSCQYRSTRVASIVIGPSTLSRPGRCDCLFMQHAFFVLFCLKTEIFSLCLTYRPHVSGETLFLAMRKATVTQNTAFQNRPPEWRFY